MLAAAVRPICLAAGLMPGTGFGPSALGVVAAARSPMTEISGCPAHAEVGGDGNAAAAVERAPVCAASRRPSGTPRRRPPRSPCGCRCARRPRPRRRPRLEGDASRVDAGDPAPGAHLDAEPRQLLARPAPTASARSCRARGRSPRAGRTRLRCGSMRRNSLSSVCRAISLIVPAISTPVGPPPMTTKVSQASRRAGSAARSACLERADHPRRGSSKRVGERLQPGRVRAATRRGRSSCSSRRPRRRGGRSAGARRRRGRPGGPRRRRPAPRPSGSSGCRASSRAAARGGSAR